MTTIEVLRRRYRLLLLAYPRWYRRERGLEMLTTLLDAAAATGQRRPTVREAVDIVGGGVRCRLRPPRPVFLLAFVPVSVFAAFTGAAVAIWLALTLLAPIPTDDVAAAVARTATGQAPRNVPGPTASCNDVYCDEQWSPGGDQVVAEDRLLSAGNHLDAVVVGYWIADDDIPAWIDDARSRLAAAGWNVGPLEIQVEGQPDEGFRRFTAETPDLQLSMHAFSRGERAASPGIFPPAAIQVQSKAPAGLSTLSGAAFLVSLLTGWLLTGWVVRRFRTHRLRLTAVAVGAVAAFGAVLMAILVDGELLLGSVADAANNDRAPVAELLATLTFVTFPPLAFLAALAALAAVVTLVAAAMPLRPRLDRHPEPGV